MKLKWTRVGKTYKFKTEIETTKGVVTIKLVRGSHMWVLSTKGAFVLDEANVALASESTAFAKKEALKFLEPRL